MAVNWKLAEQYLRREKAKNKPGQYAHNAYDENMHTATSKIETEVIVLDAKELPGLVYLMPCPKVASRL